MRISLITPAGKQSRAGNRTTAVRWARLLERLGHRVFVDVQYDGRAVDLMIALHAWRSAEAMRKYRALFPDGPLVLALTGTDLYRFIDSHPQATLGSIAMADKLVALHDLAGRVIPEAARKRLSIIHQSALPLTQRLREKMPPRQRSFDVCVVGHLRDEKDPFRAAEAVRDVPASSRLRILHYGKAHDESWAQRARAEMAINPRYHWYGEHTYGKIRELYARSRAMVLSSVMEGGANVISEAVVAGLPVLASDIDGSIGLLRADYDGYYPVGDTEALQALLLRAEQEAKFLPSLVEQAERQRPLFTEQAELEGWQRLLASISHGGL